MLILELMFAAVRLPHRGGDVIGGDGKFDNERRILGLALVHEEPGVEAGAIFVLVIDFGFEVNEALHEASQRW
ncbi:hypothetical protein, partial [Verrucomicrobium spinosum]|uniref:hypothetical protein n=1 Tax=Verrucomicrobium spinosum TaxID=2736 RepID=UPI0012E28C75